MAPHQHCYILICSVSWFLIYLPAVSLFRVHFLCGIDSMVFLSWNHKWCHPINFLACCNPCRNNFSIMACSQIHKEARHFFFNLFFLALIFWRGRKMTFNACVLLRWKYPCSAHYKVRDHFSVFPNLWHACQ